MQVHDVLHLQLTAIRCERNYAKRNTNGEAVMRHSTATAAVLLREHLPLQ